ncbi:MAG: hypothetical protein KDC85_18280 [Saprospiraceae bacterium]|nr:hypothetical protein [Saprospiraceae bacterium]MCB9325883.1 hypothetical protein [Lewinellaceae bacterium]
MYNQRVARRVNKVPANIQMINSPTVVPVSKEVGPSVPADPYISLTVDTTDAGILAPVTVVLFDASMGYQLANSFAMNPLIKIVGNTAVYQFILNDLGSSNGSYFDTIQQRIDDENVAMTQFGHPIEIHESTKGSRPRLLQTIHPGMGIHEGQYQKGINTFSFPFTVGNRTAFVYVQEPGIKITWGFYQKAELGRIK